jgi:hypothetical protein
MKTDEKIDMSTTNSGAGIAQKLTLRWRGPKRIYFNVSSTIPDCKFRMKNKGNV